MTGKTVIITGGNRGIGKETARELAKRNAKVIIAVRDLCHGNAAAEEIIESTGNPKVIAKLCDLSSFKSIRSFAFDVILNEKNLDVLICNAAVVPPIGRHLTENGFEMQFAVNHLGHFLLTNLLLGLLKQSSPSRVIVMTSVLYAFGNIDFNNLNCENYTPHMTLVYSNTKLANLLFVKELSRRLSHTRVTVNALHPGLVRTDINRRTPWYIKSFIQPIAYVFAKNTIQGAQTTVHLALSKQLECITGKYFSDCRESWTFPKSRDDRIAKKLWKISEKFTGL